MAFYPAIVVASIRKLIPNDSYEATSGTKNARNILVIGYGILFGLVAISWLLAYFHSQILQQIYHHASIWSLPVAWTLLASSLIEFIRGGLQNVNSDKDVNADEECTESREFELTHTNLTWHEA